MTQPTVSMTEELSRDHFSQRVQKLNMRAKSIDQSINQRFLKWPKWYATARTTTGNKTVGTEMS